ncbi:hypothetical protein [Amycolatopsis sp. cmx-4-68]
MWIAVSTPVALLIATVLMERFERRCTPLPAAKGDRPADARVRPVTH